MARIPEETIERIRNTADIYDVVAQYVDLKKRGRNYFGLCPFHSEKTPSFSVAPEKQIYHCFGCGSGVNVFSFIVEHEKVSFIEAVQQLGEKYGSRCNMKLAQAVLNFFQACIRHIMWLRNFTITHFILTGGRQRLSIFMIVD